MKDQKPAFNPRDTAMREGITYTGELPYQHRATCTTALYVWNSKHPTRWVDKRDLPGLAKEVGMDSLAGAWVDGKKAAQAKRAKKREGVADGN